MYMAFKMDSGDIIKQDAIDIKEDDDTLSLTKRLSSLGTKLLKEVLEDIEQGIIHREKQDEELVTFSPTLTYQDEYLSFDQPSNNIINRIKGLSPEPGAYAFINGIKIKIYKVENSDIIENEDKIPGTILSIKKKLIVKSLDGAVEIKQIQVPGKKIMAAKDFLNGQNIMDIDDIFNRGEES